MTLPPGGLRLPEEKLPSFPISTGPLRLGVCGGWRGEGELTQAREPRSPLSRRGRTSPRSTVRGAGRGPAPLRCLRRGDPRGLPWKPRPNLSSSPDPSPLAGTRSSDAVPCAHVLVAGAALTVGGGALRTGSLPGQHSPARPSLKSTFALTPTRRPVPMRSGRAHWSCNYFVTVMPEG